MVNGKKCNYDKYYLDYPVEKPTSTGADNMVNTTKPVGKKGGNPKKIIDTLKPIIEDSIDPKAYDYEMVDNKDYFFQAINGQLARDKTVASLSFRAEFIITPSKNIGTINWIGDLRQDRNKPLIEAALRKLRFEQSPKVRGNGRMCFFKMIYHK
jgi:hypothetical protein